MHRFILVPACVSVAIAAPLEIVFDAPAKNWEREALPVGNGRLGAMVFGDPGDERIQFNEHSLWSGGANESGGYEVEEFGTYQSFGDLLIGTGAGETSNYRRVLDLATGVQQTSWEEGGARHTREVFASRGHEVIVVRWTADQPGRVRGRVTLRDPRGGGSRATAAGMIGFDGRLANGLRYAAAVVAVAESGEVRTDGAALVLDGCDAATIVVAAATDYALDPGRGFRSGANPSEAAVAAARAAAAAPVKEIRAAHVADHGGMMARVGLDLGATPAEVLALPTPQRIHRHGGGAADPHLEMLLFQFGRYLLASSSRPGGLPANLQGLWADGLKPPWFADYHTNINVQMNYWLAEPANLAECHGALFDWIEACIPESRKATQKAFGDDTPGWTMRTSVNAFGGNGWQWNLPASAWLALHFWEHYVFSGDREFLARRAWPVFREVSEFWLDHMVEKDGKLVAPMGWSPEHGPREDGVAHDQQIVWGLFTRTLAAAEVLEIDDEFTAMVTAARSRLLGPQIGSWGQLMEWTTERPDREKSGHRHTSHLFAVFPGSQISTALTPDLAKAAAVSLEARGTSGDSRRSWTWPWRAALWARLGEPEKAYAMVCGLFAHNVLPNLFTTHPPFQIDGNLGITAGVCEMLLQSHAGEIAILPALPRAWANGSFTGLRARGGVTVDATWKRGKLTTATLHASRAAAVSVRLPGRPPQQVTLDPGTPVNVAGR